MAKSTKKKTSKKNKNRKGASSAVPKSLRKGKLPRPVGEVMAAGLGALRDAQTSGEDAFDDLVARGRAVQDAGGDAAQLAIRQVEQAVERVTEAASSAGSSVAGRVQDGVEGVVEGILKRLGVPGRGEVERLQATVAELTARLEAASAAGSAPRSAASPAPARSRFEVVKHPDGWAIQRVGAGRATAVLATKKEALRDARELARAQAPSELTVHNLDGSVSDTLEYDD